jgi:hypothetical protein
MADFTDMLRPKKFSGAHFKKWRVKATLWLEAMKVFWITVGSPERNIFEEIREHSRKTTLSLEEQI